jgi:hypothetical protein
MSPFRRRKRRREADLRLRARRARLAERERLAYERERALEEPDEPYEAAVETPAEPEAVEPEVVEPAPAEPEPEPVAPAPQPAKREARKPERKPRRRLRGRSRRRRVPRPSLGELRSASASGARATVRQAQPGVRRLSGLLGRVLTRPLVWLLRLAALVERAITGLLSALVRVGGRSLAAAERIFTPERGLVLVIGGAAGCLAVSQFVAYRGVEVGAPEYQAVRTIAPPAQVSRVDAGAAHAYVLVPLAALAFAIAVVALVSGRWRLGRLVSLIGLAGIVISFAIDLPKGLDAGTAGTAFAGAQATLDQGFYAQLAASAVLVLCGWLLSLNLHQRHGAPVRRGRRRRTPRPRGEPSVAPGA